MKKALVNLLVTCSDSVTIRKELLVALKHVRGTDFKKDLFPVIGTIGGKAMAVRSVLGKLGRSRFIHNNDRVSMVGSSPTVCSSPHHPFDYYGVVHDQNQADKKRNPFLHGSLMKEPVYSHLDFGGLQPARFATEELRKKRNIQLQSVRVLRVVARKDSESPRYVSSYDLLLEADDAGVMRYFEVEVSVNSSDGMWLEKFCLLVDNQKPIRLYHHLDNFFDAYAEARQQLSLDHQRKLRNETRG